MANDAPRAGAPAAEHRAGRTVLVTDDAGDYRAFVPDPLPPRLAYDPRLLTLLSDADRALGELNGLGRTLPNPDLLIGPFVRREAVLSSKIEGTRATVTDLYALEAGQSAATRRSSPDVQEVANYVDALRFGVDSLRTLPVNLALVRGLHERLLADVRGGEATPGAFRTVQNWIGPPGTLLTDAGYVPPPPAELPRLLSELEAYVHEVAPDDPPLVRLALIHAQFEMVHPFLDGNGRIGRLLVTLLLVHWELLALPMLYLSAFFERERPDYYLRLRAVSDAGDWEGWVAFFLRGVHAESLDAAARARQLQNLQRDWRSRFTGARGSALTVRLVEALFETPVLTIPRAQSILEVTYPSAKAHIDKLVDAGILAPFGEQAYGRAYAAREVLRIIGS